MNQIPQLEYLGAACSDAACYPLQEGFKKIFIFFILAGASPDYSITVFLQSRLLGWAVNFNEDFDCFQKDFSFPDYDFVL